MSVSVCVDSVDWLGTGCVSVGDEGFGVLGSSIPSTGDSGPGFAYNDLSLPADASKEICGRITTWPTNGTLYAYENTSFTYSRVGNGTDSFQYQLYVDGAPIGSPQTVTLQIGSTNATATGATLTATSTITAGSATGTAAGTAPGANLTATSSITPGAATGAKAATAAGATLTATATISAGTASGATGTPGTITYARAPSGIGYKPQRDERQSRPPAIQDGYR